MERSKKDIAEELQAVRQYFEENNDGACPLSIIDAIEELKMHPEAQWNKISECNSFISYKCSNCFRMISIHNPEKSITNMSIEDQLAFYPFCHCGADMRKGLKALKGFVIHEADNDI